MMNLFKTALVIVLLLHWTNGQSNDSCGADTSSCLCYQGAINCSSVSVSGLLDNMQSVSQFITDAIPEFFRYQYDRRRSGNSIRDGGNDMFDTGNQIFFGNTLQSLTQANYNRFYTGPGFKFLSRAIYPFIATMWIDGQTTTRNQSYFLQVTGNAGADNAGSFDPIRSTTISHKNFSISYSGFQIYGTRDPTICTLFFYITSSSKWKSVETGKFSTFHVRRETNVINTYVRVSGNPKRVVLGYMLLSSYRVGSSSKAISNFAIVRALRIVTTSLSYVRYSDTNECINGQNNCHSFAYCTNALESYSCTCRRGYTGDGRNCTDINECESRNDVCASQPYSTCVNRNGSFSCVCNPGFRGSSVCIDINECLNVTCGRNEVCVNTIGNYSCQCRPGYFLNGTDCAEINECVLGNHTCRFDSHCVNLDGSYSCLCYVGQTGGAINCSDLTTDHFFHVMKPVFSNINSIIPDWYAYKYDGGSRANKIIDGGLDMFDIGNKVNFGSTSSLTYLAFYNATYNRREFQFLTKAVHPFVALMWINNTDNDQRDYTIRVNGNSGADGSGYFRSINQRKFQDGVFNVTYGVYQVHGARGSDPSICKVFFYFDSLQLWDSVPASMFNMTTSTRTTDELDASVHIHGAPQRVLVGYLLLSRVQGELVEQNQIENLLRQMVRSLLTGNQLDVNECVENSHNCHPNATCINVYQNYTCACNAGFSGNGFVCTDINECVEQSYLCTGPGSQCVNSVGSFTCNCPEGFAWNGRACTDINECLNRTNQCDANANCFNNVGSYSCSCKSGFSGDGLNCNDINECTEGISTCQQGSSCDNFLGGYTCSCYNGVPGGPINCSDITTNLFIGNIGNLSTSIISFVTDWYSYVYDSSNGRDIRDGGRDMFDNGNLISFGKSLSTLNPARYNQTYMLPDYQFTTRAIHPFVALMWINSTATNNQDYIIKVSGNAGADGQGSSRLSRVYQVNANELNITYQTFQIFGTIDATICEVFFTVQSTQIWNSVSPSRFKVLSLSSSTDSYNTRATISGNPERMLFGYFLLSRRGRSRTSLDISNDEIERLVVFVADSFQVLNFSNVDECDDGTHACHPNATCINNAYNYTCLCPSGTTGSGFTCSDVDECDDGSNLCHSSATCTNFVGGYSCSCSEGLTGNGRICTDINECRSVLNNCDTNAECINTFGSFTCECNNGFLGDGLSCIDIDECSNGNHTCQPNSLCTNNEGRYDCTCYNGSPGGPINCSEINPTSLLNNIEFYSQLLTSSIDNWYQYIYSRVFFTEIDDGGFDMFDNGNRIQFGSSYTRLSAARYNSSYRRPGYSFSSRSFYPFTSILWVDENSSGNRSYWIRVTGNAGADGAGSININEKTSILIGQFNVTYSVFQIHATSDPTICEVFFYIHSEEVWNSVPAQNYTFTSRSASTNIINTDVNIEGKPLRVVLGYMLLSRRIPTELSPSVSDENIVEMLTGLIRSFQSPSVIDINECANGDHRCDNNAYCENTAQSYTCICRTGYTGNGTVCEDVDECSTGNNSCSSSAQCINTPGSYICNCSSGFYGNGRSCFDIDECATGTHLCLPNSICINTNGEYNCSCESGYFLNGSVCQDINECEAGTHHCGSQSDCINLIGGYKCLCYNAQSGGPINCTDISSIQLLNNIEAISIHITQAVRSWYSYTYDGIQAYTISDGGRDMFDGGNIVTFGTNFRQLQRAIYNQTYTNDGFQFTSRPIHPFIGLMWINGTSSATRSYYIKINGNAGADGSGLINTIPETNFVYHGFNVTYSSRQIYSSSDPTICEVFFYIHSTEIWRSVPAQIYAFTSISSSTDIIDNYITLSGSPERVLLGYMLLSKYTISRDASRVSVEEIRQAVLTLVTSLQSVTFINVNECEQGNHTCDSNALCQNTLSNYTCICRSGFTGDGFTCTDINECNQFPRNCHRNANCTNTVGSFYCNCLPGYTGNGFFCRDINECTQNITQCEANAICENNPGSYSCVCQIGFSGDGTTCIDIDECSTGSHNCRLGSECTNLPGGYTCTCYGELAGGPINCSDLTVNSLMNNIQQVSREIKTSIRSWYPYIYDSTVRRPYSILDGGRDMYDNGNIVSYGMNIRNLLRARYNQTYRYYSYELATRTIHPFTTLMWIKSTNSSVNSHIIRVNGGAGADGSGSIRITANQNFTLYSFDVTYSVFQIYNSRDPSICQLFYYIRSVSAWSSVPADRFEFRSLGRSTDTINTYVTLRGRPARVLMGYTLLSRSTSNEITSSEILQTLRIILKSLRSVQYFEGDACSSRLHDCSLNATCTALSNGYQCQCKQGFIGNGYNCTDVNECTSGSNTCSKNAQCTNTIGNYTCSCSDGYSGNGFTCSDVDECGSGLHSCDINASCTNTNGNYSCVCKNGYTGNGITCTDLNECSSGNNMCDVNAVCSNTIGSYGCSCMVGYTGNGFTCSDIDECTNSSNQCHFRSACINTIGSYSCTCNKGFQGNGKTCSDIDECSNNKHNCHNKAICTNIAGGYTCLCQNGYNGNGTFCSDFDECSSDTHNCHANANCTNTIGSYNCLCVKGFSGNGIFCLDIDECTQGTHDCHHTANCTNLIGNFSCVCKNGFSGNGRQCIDPLASSSSGVAPTHLAGIIIAIVAVCVIAALVLYAYKKRRGHCPWRSRSNEMSISMLSSYGELQEEKL